MSKRKDPAAVSLGRRGGRAAAGAGLKSWRATLTPAQRSEIARRAGRARWVAERLYQLWEPAGMVAGIAAHESHGASRLDGDHAPAVKLFLVHPALAMEWARHFRRVHEAGAPVAGAD